MGDIFGYFLDRDYKFNESCILSWLTARIYPNGDVGLCNSYIFVNLNTHSLKEIINNKQGQSFREMFRKGKFEREECFRCCHKHYY
jgi:radical SAM protein with 4Fe4S-binding SPASM domain